jgi:hypothetical protein
MADVAERLPERIESGAVKRMFYSTEVVRTDGGHQFTNQRWDEPLAEWDITVPQMKRSSADYIAVKALFDAVAGSALTFDFHDVEACEDVEVRVKGDTLVWEQDGPFGSFSLTLEKAR